MIPIRVRVSSVVKEFASERAVLSDHLRGDLLRRFFEVFRIDDVPASRRQLFPRASSQ